MLAFNPPRTHWHDGGELDHTTARRSSGRGERKSPDPGIAVEKGMVPGEGSRWATVGSLLSIHATAANGLAPASSEAWRQCAMATVERREREKESRKGPWNF